MTNPNPALRFPPIAPELCTVALAVLDSRETADDIVRTDSDIQRLVDLFGGRVFGAADVAATLDDGIAEAREDNRKFTGIPVRVIDLEGPNRVPETDVDVFVRYIDNVWCSYREHSASADVAVLRFRVANGYTGTYSNPLAALEAAERRVTAAIGAVARMRAAKAKRGKLEAAFGVGEQA